MKMNKTALAVSIAGALGFSAPFANAQIILGDSTTALPIASEAPSEGTISYYNDANGRLEILIPTITNYVVTPGSNDLFIKIAPKSGVRFGTNFPILKCDTAGASANFTGTIISADSPSNTQVTFTFPSAMTVATACKLVVASAANASGYNSAAYTVPGGSDFGSVTLSAVYEYRDGFALKVSGTQSTIITYKPAVSNKAGTVGANSTAAQAIINVQDGSRSFNSTTRPSTTEAFLGTYKCSTALQSEATQFADQASANKVEAGDIYSSFSITLNGTPIAGASTVSIKQSAATVCGGTNHESKTPASGATTVTFSAVTPANVSAGLHFCLGLDGNKTVDAGTITLSVTPATKTNWTDKGCAVASTPLVEITKDGTSIRILNITRPAAQEKTFIRLYNTGNTTTTVLGTLYDQAGAQIGSANTTIATIPPNQVVVLRSDTDIQPLFSDFTGRAHMRIEADTDKLEVLATLRTLSGVLTNMSAGAK